MSEETPSTRRVPLHGTEGTIATYANVCNISMTPEELYLQFGQREVDNPNEARHLTTICMSLAHAKRLANALARSIETYETLFGEIAADAAERLSPEMRQQFEAQPSGEKQNGA